MAFSRSIELIELQELTDDFYFEKNPLSDLIVKNISIYIRIFYYNYEFILKILNLYGKPRNNSTLNQYFN